MISITTIVQVIVALGIYNVWFVRANRKTAYRGKNAPNLKAEFRAYGLPSWSVYVVGAIKVVAATGLLVGLWLPQSTLLSATVLAVMMLGAVTMHIKVSDSLKQTTPALLMLIMCVYIILQTLHV